MYIMKHTSTIKVSNRHISCLHGALTQTGLIYAAWVVPITVK